MSTKELYTALLTARMDAEMQMIHQMDEAIRQYMDAEQKLYFLTQHSSDLLRRRVKLILCEEAAKRPPIQIEGSEQDQLKALANALNCPNIMNL